MSIFRNTNSEVFSWPKKKWIDKLNNQGEAFKLEFKNFSLGKKYG